MGIPTTKCCRTPELPPVSSMRLDSRVKWLTACSHWVFKMHLSQNKCEKTPVGDCCFSFPNHAAFLSGQNLERSPQTENLSERTNALSFSKGTPLWFQQSMQTSLCFGAYLLVRAPEKLRFWQTFANNAGFDFVVAGQTFSASHKKILSGRKAPRFVIPVTRLYSCISQMPVAAGVSPLQSRQLETWCSRPIPRCADITFIVSRIRVFFADHSAVPCPFTSHLVVSCSSYLLDVVYTALLFYVTRQNVSFCSLHRKPTVCYKQLAPTSNEAFQVIPTCARFSTVM